MANDFNGYDLAKFPARLAEQKLPDWKGYILREAGVENTTELAKRLAEETGKNYRSVRPPLSDFLNGYSRDILSWVGNPDDLNAYADALCKRIPPTPNQLFQRFLRLIEPDTDSQTIGGEALAYFPLAIRWAGDDFRADDTPPKIEALTELRRYLEKQNRAPLLPEDLGDDLHQNRLDWSQFKLLLLDLQEKIEAASLPLRLQLSISHHTADGRRADRLITDLATSRVRSFCQGQRLFQLPTDAGDPSMVAHEVIHIPLTFMGLERDHFSQWVRALKNQYYLNADQARRIDQALPSLPLDTLGALSREHLLKGTDYFRDHPIVESPRRFVELRARWTRHDLLEKTNSDLARRWLEDGADAEFFMRCLESARTPKSDYSPALIDGIVDIEHCLDIEDSPSGEANLSAYQRLLEDLVLADDHTRAALRRQAMSYLPSSLKLELIEADLLKPGSPRGEEESYFLEDRLVELGLLELALGCDTSLLKRLIPYTDGNGHADTVLKQAARIADVDQINAWCKYLLVDDSRAIQTMLTLLDGLAAHHAPNHLIDLPSLHQLWAATIALIIEDQRFCGDPALSSLDYSFMAKVSESLQDHLPVLDGDEGPMSSLLSLIPSSVADDLQFDNSAGRSLSTRLLLLELAPFQLPYQEIDELIARVTEKDSLKLPGRIAELILRRGEPFLSLARRGDLATRRALLQGASTLAAADIEIRHQLSTTEWLQWWIELARQDGDDGNYERFDYDCGHALDEYFQSTDEGLATLLSQALQTPLKDHLPGQLSPIVRALQEGYEALITFFLQELNRPHQDRRGWPEIGILIPTIALWLGASDTLRDLCEVDLKALPLAIAVPLCSADLENTQGRYLLRFDRLEKLAELRHRSLLTLARLAVADDREPHYLRDSLHTTWELSSPILATERRLFHRINLFFGSRKEALNDRELPAIDDDLWAQLLLAINHGQPLSELREQILRGIIPARDQQLYLLSIEHLPQDQRWPALRPVMGRIWQARRQANDHLSPGSVGLVRLWELIKKTKLADEIEASDTWRPPHDRHQHWRQERYRWALKHDDETLRQWCEDPHRCDLYELSTDLSRAHRAWQYLSDHQREELLWKLPGGPVADLWWSRGMELPLERRLQFARQHGTIGQRQAIAQQLLGKYSDPSQAQDYLLKWASLYSDERPLTGPDNQQVDRFFKDLAKSKDDDQPSDSQLRIATALINSFQYLKTAQILTLTGLLTKHHLRALIRSLRQDESPERINAAFFGGLPLREFSKSDGIPKQKIWKRIEVIFTINLHGLESDTSDADHRHRLVHRLQQERERFKGYLVTQR